MNIEKYQFEAYVNVQKSGVTNMWDVKRVCQLAEYDFDEDEALYIMKHYAELRDKFKEVE